MGSMQNANPTPTKLPAICKELKTQNVNRCTRVPGYHAICESDPPIQYTFKISKGPIKKCVKLGYHANCQSDPHFQPSCNFAKIRYMISSKFHHIYNLQMCHVNNFDLNTAPL